MSMIETSPPVVPNPEPENPVIEVILDIDCDFPQPLDLLALEERANAGFKADYPDSNKKVLFEQQVMADFRSDQPVEPTISPPRHSVHAIRYQRAVPATIVQLRTTGYSFNCLPPYKTLDDHLDEIRRTWEVFCGIAAPGPVRQISLRHINRLDLPFESKEQRLELDSYLALGPRLTDEHRLTFTGFFHRHEVLEVDTGNQATITLTTQPSTSSHLPIILDLASRNILVPTHSTNWDRISEVITSLRALNNHIFKQSLTETCRARYPSLR